MTILNGTNTVLQVNSSGAAPPADTTAPVLQTVATSVDGLTVTLTYNEALDTGSTPVTGDFSFSPSKTISNVNVTGSTVVLTVSVAFDSGDTITLDYTAASNPIQDSAGNDAVNLSGQSVTNNVTGFSPTDIASLVGWYDAQDNSTITTSNGNVTTWADKSGNGYDFTGGSPDHSDANDAITFVSSNSDTLSNTADVANFDTNTGTLFFIAENLTANFFEVVSIYDSSQSNDILRVGFISNNIIYQWKTAASATPDLRGTTTLTDATYYIVCLTSDGSTINAYLNGSPETLSETTGTNNGNWFGDITGIDGIAFGSSLDNTPNYRDGSIKSLLYFNDVLSTSDRNSMFTYLNDRFAIY